MEFFKASNFKLRNVYGLPTLRGLALFGILGFALWISLTKNSEIERWLFLSMILLVLVHLNDSSLPFRMLELTAVSIPPPFQGEVTEVLVQVSNPTDQKIENLYLKLQDGDWTKIDPISAHSTVRVRIPYRFDDAGKQRFPKLTVKNYQPPQFFRFWRVLSFDRTIYVLPAPRDLGVRLSSRTQGADDEELAGFVPIVDPRDLPLRDQKLFLKTGTSYQREHRSTRVGQRIELDWAMLNGLESQERAQQFSFWIKMVSEQKSPPPFGVLVKTPFLVENNSQQSLDWSRLKSLYAHWLYEKT